jgi:hypothetical protein
MANAFGVTADFIDADLSAFVANKRLNCKIDKVGGFVETVRAESKSAQYQQLVKQVRMCVFVYCLLAFFFDTFCVCFAGRLVIDKNPEAEPVYQGVTYRMRVLPLLVLLNVDSLPNTNTLSSIAAKERGGKLFIWTGLACRARGT